MGSAGRVRGVTPVQADAPRDPIQWANWLPAPKDADFSLFVRAYWPREEITSGRWTPPAVMRAEFP
jgi:hypothetical protein